jgi:hypothetical protein
MDLESTVLGHELMGTVGALRRLVRPAVTAGSARTARGAQLELMRVVEQQPGIGIAPAAWVLHLGANIVSTLVDQLIDLGMVVRDTDPDYRRAARLWLTDSATQRLVAGGHVPCGQCSTAESGEVI